MQRELFSVIGKLLKCFKKYVCLKNGTFPDVFVHDDDDRFFVKVNEKL